ncbi:MAG: LicD family protein [Bacteroidales bacterium]|nr:LicD family protein [Bacteroidales bacterium]
MDTQSRYRRILLGTFRAFSDLCGQNGIRWWLAFGAAIGAVRHGGMIPWDDDIDVFMPREDYERFLSLKRAGYEIVELRSGRDLPFAYAKFCDASTTLVEQRRYPVTTGVFIDIFPLDEAGPDPEPLRRLYRSSFTDYVRSFRLHFAGEWFSDLLHGKWRGCAVALQDLVWMRPRHKTLRQRFLDAYSKAASQPSSGAYAVWCTNSEYTGITFPHEWFARTDMVPFEDMTVPLPGGNHALLTLLYGDYMSLPPQEQRTSGHLRYYLNLNERI